MPLLVNRSALLEVMDPSDKLDYGLDFSAQLDPGEVIASADWRLTSTAIAQGVELNNQAYNDTQAIVWLTVADAEQGNARWDGAGQSHVVTAFVGTSAGRERDRSLTVTIRHRNV